MHLIKNKPSVTEGEMSLLIPDGIVGNTIITMRCKSKIYTILYNIKRLTVWIIQYKRLNSKDPYGWVAIVCIKTIYSTWNNNVIHALGSYMNIDNINIHI